MLAARSRAIAARSRVDHEQSGSLRKWLKRRSAIEPIIGHLLRPIVLTALTTGMHFGEILALTWNDVDFRRRQIHVRDSKNGEGRVLEMSSTFMDTLQHVRRRPQSPHVFLGRDGRPVIDVRKAFTNACRRADISDFRFHDLRHTFASHLVMNGTDLMTVKELLGHKTLQMTLRYAHLSQSHKRQAIEALGRVLDGHYMDTADKMGLLPIPARSRN